MTVKIDNKEIELKYTFNSFKYMKEFSPAVMENLENQPFMVLDFLHLLLMGALNNDKKVKISHDQVDDFLEDFFEQSDGDVSELIEELMGKLQESSFFKKLQGKQE